MEFKSWHDVLLWVVIGVAFLFGAPIIQLIKVGLGKLFKKPIKDNAAVAVAVAVAAGLSLLELWLSGQLNSWPLTFDSFPEFFGAVFSLATVWFQLFIKGKQVE